jgi:hypothetical protein
MVHRRNDIRPLIFAICVIWLTFFILVILILQINKEGKVLIKQKEIIRELDAKIESIIKSREILIPDSGNIHLKQVK